MDNVTIPGLLNFIDRTKQTVKSGLGLLADNPSEWAAQTAARYFPTREEERQFNALQKSGADMSALYESPIFKRYLRYLNSKALRHGKTLARKPFLRMSEKSEIRLMNLMISRLSCQISKRKSCKSA